MNLHMKRILERVEAGTAVRADLLQMALEIKAQEARIAELEADSDRITQQVVAATLRKVDSYEQGTQRLRDIAFEEARL